MKHGASCRTGENQQDFLDISFHGWKLIEAHDKFGDESFPLLSSPEGLRFFSLEDVIDFLAESFEDITGEDVLERKEERVEL